MFAIVKLRVRDHEQTKRKESGVGGVVYLSQIIFYTVWSWLVYVCLFVCSKYDCCFVVIVAVVDGYSKYTYAYIPVDWVLKQRKSML